MEAEKDEMKKTKKNQQIKAVTYVEKSLTSQKIITDEQ